MRRLGGQAIRHGIGGFLGVLLLLGAALGGLAWALSDHPIAVPWLAQRLQQEADRALGPGAVKIRAAAIGWEGFRSGGGDPLAIRLEHVAARLPGLGRAEAQLVYFQLKLWPLLHGVLRPVSATLENADITLDKLPAGASQGQAPSVPALLDSRPLADAPPWAQSLSRLAVRNTTLRVAHIGKPLATAVNATVQRGDDGHVQVAAAFTVRPPDLAALFPAFAEAARLQAPVAVRLDGHFGPDGRPLTAKAVLRAAPGEIRLAATPVSLLAGSASAAWSRAGGLASTLDLALRPGDGAMPTHVKVEARAQQEAGNRVAVSGRARIDQVDFATLPLLWPMQVAKDPREWITGNITAGTASGLDVSFALSAGDDGSNPTLETVSGGGTGHDVTVHWLRPVPPVRHIEATLTILRPDAIGIDFSGGQEQVPAVPDPLHAPSGRIVITGLTVNHQFADINATIAGSIPAALGLLSEPRLHLLSDHPISLKDPRGEATATIGATVPLENKVRMDDVQIGAAARLTDVSLDDVVAGRSLSDGTIDLKANTSGLSMAGTGAVAGIPGQFSVTMDFRAGPPTQVLERIEARTAGTPIARLTALGLDTGGLLSGRADFSAVYSQRRNGTAMVGLHAGLYRARIAVDALGWSKPQGAPAQVSAQLLLDRDGHIRGIQAIEGSGRDFALRGRAELLEDGATRIDLDQLVLGRTDAHGWIAIGRGGDPVDASLTGPVLDLGPRLAQAGSAGDSDTSGKGGWDVAARFTQALLANERPVSDFALRTRGRGGQILTLQLSADTGAGAPVRVSIAPDGDGRNVQATAADGGALLHDLGALSGIAGGKLSVLARFDDAAAGHPLSGVAELDNFRLRGAPKVAKALQAMSLYGLVQAMDGPGMAFTRLVAPFAFAHDIITLGQARAFNPSLGFTATGRLNLDTNRMLIQGTVVPAYYLNTALGRIPVIGRLFSPEKGGGLIAANYTATGSMDDPAISVNPLSALTPGFLRGIFGSEGTR